MRGGSVPDLERAEQGARRRRAGSSERGEGRLKALVWLAILACLIYVGIKTVPVLFDEFEFQDAIQSAARFGSVNNQTPDDIRDGLVRQAETIDIPIKPEDIHVTKAAGDVSVDARYSVTVDLGVYQWTFNFHPSAHNAAL